jgi:iron complex transport system permease protein
LLIICVTLITSAVVSVCGIIGWVGLVIPHMARMITGPDHRLLFPASAFMGSIFFLLIDDLARGLTQAEIPVGILTAIIGAPVFGVLLKRTHAGGWKND